MAAIQVLRLLLFDDQLGVEDLQQVLADDTSARLEAYLGQSARLSAGRPLAPTVAELRVAVLQLAKQGYWEHSRSIRLSRMGGGGAKSSQPSAKQGTGVLGGAPPSPSAFPALPSAGRAQPATPTAATPTSSWAASLTAAAAPTPASAIAPSPASVSVSGAGAGDNGARLQGAWAQGPLAAMSQKKQAALDERMRGRTPHLPSPAEGTWAAPSPTASTGSTNSVPAGAWAKGGRQAGSRQQHTPAGPGQAPGQGQVGAQDGGTAGGSGGGGGGVAVGGCWANGLPPSGGRTGPAATAASPSAANGTPHHTRSVGPVGPQGHGQGPGQGGGKRIVPMPVHHQQQQQVTAAWPSPLCGPVSSSASPATSAMNAWGVPPVNTSKQQQQQRQASQPRSQQQHQQQHQQQVMASCGAAATKEPAAGATDDVAVELDPSTPCSAVVSALGGAPALATPPALDPAAAQQNDPVTPAAQIVPAVSDGSLSQHGSAVQDAFRARYCSPPSVSSYPQGRPPVGPSRPAHDLSGPGRLPHVEESPASFVAVHGEGVAVTPAGNAGGPLVPVEADPRSGSSHAVSSGLGAVWGAAHERLARLHAGVLCAGSVPCLQDEVSDLLYLLACPPEVLLVAAEADGNDAAALVAQAGTKASTAGRPGGAQGQQLEWPLQVAVQYACAVLSHCGGLLSGLGHRLLAAVATCSAARLTAPALAAAADAAAQRRERSLARSRAVDALGGQRLQLVGPMLQSGNDMASGKSRSHEQQRRVSNRERCRDLFFAVVRQVASLLSRGGDFGGLSDGNPGAGGSGRGYSAACAPGQTPPPLGPVPGPGGAGLGTSGAAAAELLLPLRAQCLDVLQWLHPDNLPFFAELFTGCVLQAAATGESLVEGDLANLASRNPSKFQRLNQRMQQAPGQVLSQHAPSPHQQQSTPTQPGGRGARTPGGYTEVVGYGAAVGGRLHGGPSGTPGPYSNSSTYSAFSHRGGGGGGGYPSTYGSGGPYGAVAAGGGGSVGPGGAYGTDGNASQPRDMLGVSARCAATLQRMSYFPLPQRPYIFFLEATDSQSLVTSVARHMSGALQAMLLKALGVSSTSTGTAVHGHSNGGPAAIGPSPASSVGPLGDHVVATGTLASYLAYLSVVHGAVRYGVALPQAQEAASRSGVGFPISPVPQPDSPLQLLMPRHPPLDVMQLLCVAEERGMLVHVVPCIAQYLFIITSGQRIAAGSAADAGQALPTQATDGGDAMGAAVIDLTAVQLPYLRAITGRLRRLLASRALQPQQPGFCAAALCLRSAAEEALSHAAAVIAAADVGGGGGDAATTIHYGDVDCLQRRPSRGEVEMGDAGGAAAAAGGGAAPDWDARLAASLQESDGLVDSRLLELCCPAIEAASRVLQRASAAAAKLLQQHLSAAGGGGGGSTPAAAAAGSPGSAGSEPRPLMPRRVPPAALIRQGNGGSGTGAAVTVPIPASVAAVLSAPGPSPLQQALAQALLGQYSTGEHAVPMRDVVSYVTGVLAVNGAAAALELIVPQVASEHLGRLADSVRPVLQQRVRRWQDDAATAAALAAAALGSSGRELLADRDEAGAGDTPRASVAAPPMLPLSEAMTAAAALADKATATATAATLEAALPAVRRQLRENALRSLQALLPGTVPEEAVSAAAVLAAQSAEVACLQRLVAHVPAAVRSHMDEQVKHVVREVVREVERQEAETILLPPQSEALPEQDTSTAEAAARSSALADAAASVSGVGGADGVLQCAVGGGFPTTNVSVVGTSKLEVSGDGSHGIASPGLDTKSVTSTAAAQCQTKHACTRGHGAAAAAADPAGAGAGASLPCADDGLMVTAVNATTTVTHASVAAVVERGALSGSTQEARPCDDGIEPICGAIGSEGEEAADAGHRLADLLMDLARRPIDPPLDEVVQLTGQCVSRAVALRPPKPLGGGGSGGGDGTAVDWASSSAAAAAAAAARCLYDAIRGGELEAADVERLLVRCLRAACATASAGGAAAAAWGARPPQLPASLAPAGQRLLPPPVAAAAIEAAADADNGAAAFAFLAEVSLVIVQRNAEDSHTWADVVWQPLPAAALEVYEQDSDSECVPAESDLGSGSGVSPSDSASQVSGSASPSSGGGAAAAAVAAAATAARRAALPPMLANLYHHLAAYARDVESYRMLRALRLALQRVTMGHLMRLDGTPGGRQEVPQP